MGSPATEKSHEPVIDVGAWDTKAQPNNDGPRRNTSSFDGGGIEDQHSPLPSGRIETQRPTGKSIFLRTKGVSQKGTAEDLIGGIDAEWAACQSRGTGGNLPYEERSQAGSRQVVGRDKGTAEQDTSYERESGLEIMSGYVPISDQPRDEIIKPFQIIFPTTYLLQVSPPKRCLTIKATLCQSSPPSIFRIQQITP